MAKILIADDDRELTDLVAHWLTDVDGHLVEVVASGYEALDRLRFYEYDLLVLDWGMPDCTGIDVCKTFRANKGNLPIIMLTAKDKVREKEIGFDAGADDYLTKPFELRELSSRVKALLRRPAQLAGQCYQVGTIRLDASLKQVMKDQTVVKLTSREYELLEILMKNAERLMTAEQLANKLWPSESDASTLSIKPLISRLRSKLSDTPDQCIIHTEHGRGYCVRQPAQCGQSSKR